ncbi:MAG: T9SS type A sorting domain-containing protein [Melioribacteraceae bacterium]|nr:T9SS type A sorting domain-containing protein [Melioribacteraceae bacterium]
MQIRLLLFILFVSASISVIGQGKVYFVIGSDTGIWDGLDVAKHIHHYNGDLYTNTSRNAYQVMEPSFRNSMLDSYGTPMKLTWWMMAGNTFRNSDNTNVPNSNSIVFYLMKKYHGDRIKLFNDELSLHFHTFTWTDYDGDGKFWWNQALNFEEYFDDFKFTLAQLLLDENIFPVSFRSGWHYMDNEWQNYLENVLPFSLHNDYPNKHIDNLEPLDNLYDWSLSTPNFIPYRVSAENYQLAGNLKSYNVRSVYTKSFSQTMSNKIFENAANGMDQVVCIWSHLPENDFLDQLVRVDSLIQISAVNNSNAKFEYCTGVEAYQKWLKNIDSSPPELNITSILNDDQIYFNISTDENIFQTAPFVAVKDVYEQYTILTCSLISENNWRTIEQVKKGSIAKVGAAVTDTSGNLSTKFITYLPDDIFIDNTNFKYEEIYGKWFSSDISSWEKDCRMVNFDIGDSAKARWSISVPNSVAYNMYFQLPKINNIVSDISLNLISDEDTIKLNVDQNRIVTNDWFYLTTALLDSSVSYTLIINLKETKSNASSFASDVIKISPLIKEKEISISPKEVDFGDLVVNDTAKVDLIIKNKGINPLTISSINSSFSNVEIDSQIPLVIEGMSEKSISLFLSSENLGFIADSLVIISDDLIRPRLAIYCYAQVVNPFVIIDNEDITNYNEAGEWSTSVAQAYGNSSRFSYLNQTPLASAIFTTELNTSGIYDVYTIIPETKNSSDKALYTLLANGKNIDSIYINQNEIGGNWSILFRSDLPAGFPISVKVEDTGISTTGPVLRADAIKFQLISEITDIKDNANTLIPISFKLDQNYPNPFNPNTTINYQIKDDGYVSLKIYDLLGREVAVIIDKNVKAGFYSNVFDAGDLSSGVYFYRLKTNKFNEIKKMILLR